MININYNILLAFFLGVGLRIITNPWVLGYYDENYSVHKNKIYDSLLFGSVAGLIQVIINNNMLTNGERIFWSVLFLSIFFSLNYIIKEQIFIKEDDLLLQLKENCAESIKYSDIQLENKNISNDLRDFLYKENKEKQIAIQKINIMLDNYKSKLKK